MENFREFDAGPDPFGRTWHVLLKWLQTAISIRHSDSVDVKFILRSGEEETQKTISMLHAALRELAHKTDRVMSDAWCARLAALHLKSMVESGEDMDKALINLSPEQLARHAQTVSKREEEQIRGRRGAA